MEATPKTTHSLANLRLILHLDLVQGVVLAAKGLGFMV